MRIKLNESSFEKLEELLNSGKEIIFDAEYAFNKDLLAEINKHCRGNARLCFRIGEDINIDLLRLIPNIQHLSISGQFSMGTDYTVKELDVLSDFENLKTLKLGICVKKNISFSSIMHLKTLHEFNFTDGAFGHKTQYEFVNQQQNIEKLHVYKLDLSLLSRKHLLVDLNIHRTLNNETLLAERFPNLRKFCLHGDSRRQNHSFIENLLEVEDISINYNSYLTSFPTMKSPKKMKRICMLECPNFSNIDSLLAFENLETLCLTTYNKSLQISESDFSKLKQLKKLTTVYTSWGRKRTPDGIEKLYKETGWKNSMI